MDLLEMVKHYQSLLETKDDLAEQTKANNAAIEAAKAEITQQMVDDEKRSDAELAESGLDFLDTLREEGLGDIIVEKVDPRTLQSTVKAYVEEHGELSEGLEGIIRTFDYNDITRRKEKKK